MKINLHKKSDTFV